MGDAGLPAPLRASLESTKVSYTQLGRSGLRVSVPILGAMSFGESFGINRVALDFLQLLTLSQPPWTSKVIPISMAIILFLRLLFP